MEKEPQQSFRLSKSEVELLSKEYAKISCRYSRTRILGVMLYGIGTPIKDILARLAISRSALYRWLQAYREQGLDGLIDRRKGGNNARLTPEQIDELTYHINAYTPKMLFGENSATSDGDQWTVEDIYQAVWQWYGVKYKSRTSYYDLLDKCLLDRQAAEDNSNVTLPHRIVSQERRQKEQLQGQIQLRSQF